MTIYQLENVGATGSVLLVRGPENVYYTRTIVPTDKAVGIGSCIEEIDRMRVQIGYLAQFRLESVEDTAQLIHAVTHIVYTSLSDFQREVGRYMKQQEEGIRELIRAGEKDGFRTHTPLRIAPEVLDRRQKAKGPLPALGSREIELR